VEAVDNREPGVLFRFTDDDVQFQFVGQNAHESQRQRRQLDAVEFLQQLSQLGFHLPQSLSPSAPTPIITPTHSAPSPERPISQMASLARTFSQFVKDSDLPSCQQWSEAAFFPRLVDFFNGFSHEEHGSVCEHPLIIASETNDSRVARALVSQGFVDAVVLSRGQKSALHVASELGHVEVLSCLLEVTTVLLLDAACEYGPTPLWAAASGNHVGAVKLLHGKGAGIDVPCHRTHTTPLWQACRCDCVDVVTWLLGNGADVNFARHSDGVTPLWIACASGHVNVVHSLLASGALVDQVPATDSQLTPFAVASSLGHLAITRMLLSHFPRGSIDVTLWDAASSNLHTLKHLV
jgi:Ankyrin repeats (3 copies)